VQIRLAPTGRTSAARWWTVARPLSFRRVCFALQVFTMIGMLAPTTVGAEVARAEDAAACNAEARDAIRPESTARSNAVPNTGDHSRAAQAQQTETSAVTRSPDAQLDGMDGEGAKDPAYQAAFRGCMRRKGF
jgi:hypothetical protein